MAVQFIGNNCVGDNENNGIDTTALANVGVFGLDGNDRIVTSNASASNVFEGNAGADFMEFSLAPGGGSAGGQMYGGSGNDTLSGAALADALYGGEGDDLIIGNWQNSDADADRLYGGSGRDALYGNGGDDALFGGDGNDSGEISTAGTDTAFNNLVDRKTQAGLYGGDGNDYLDGGSGDDHIEGGNGNDEGYGGSGKDIMFGNAGDDQLSGGGGTDVINGDDGNDSVDGGAGDDVINLGSGNDEGHGGSGSDALKGFGGADTLHGGNGNDQLFGGLGKDVLSGGAGADIFVFDTELSASNNVDRIRDFSRSDGDKIGLAPAIFTAIGPSLDKKEFVIGKKAKDKNDYIVVNQKKGTIAYDADGKGGAKAIVFATVEKGLKLAHTDFELGV